MRSRRSRRFEIIDMPQIVEVMNIVMDIKIVEVESPMILEITEIPLLTLC